MNGNEQKRITYFKNIILIFQCQEDNSNQLYNARYVNSNFHGSNKNFLNDSFLVFYLTGNEISYRDYVIENEENKKTDLNHVI